MKYIITIILLCLAIPSYAGDKESKLVDTLVVGTKSDKYQWITDTGNYHLNLKNGSILYFRYFFGRSSLSLRKHNSSYTETDIPISDDSAQKLMDVIRSQVAKKAKIAKVLGLEEIISNLN